MDSLSETDEKPEIYDLLPEESLELEPNDLAGPNGRKSKQPKAEEVFPWIKEILSELRNLRPSGCLIKEILKIMDLYIKYLREEVQVNGVIRYPNRCHELARNVSRMLLLFKDFNSIFAFSTTYWLKVTELLGLYTCFELKYSTKFDAPRGLIADRITMNYDIILGSVDISYLLRVFIQIPHFFEQREIMCKIFQKYFKKPTAMKQLNDNLYSLYLISFKIWKSLETVFCEKANIDVIASYYMPMPSFKSNPMFRNILQINYAAEEEATNSILSQPFRHKHLARVLLMEDKGNVIDLSAEDDTIPVVPILCLESDSIGDSSRTSSPQHSANGYQIKKERPDISGIVDLTEDDAQKATTEDCGELKWIHAYAKQAKILENLIGKPINSSNIETVIVDDSDEDELEIPLIDNENQRSRRVTVDSEPEENVNIVKRICDDFATMEMTHQRESTVNQERTAIRLTESPTEMEIDANSSVGIVEQCPGPILSNEGDGSNTKAVDEVSCSELDANKSVEAITHAKQISSPCTLRRLSESEYSTESRSPETLIPRKPSKTYQGKAAQKIINICETPARETIETFLNSEYAFDYDDDQEGDESSLNDASRNEDFEKPSENVVFSVNSSKITPLPSCSTGSKSTAISNNVVFSTARGKLTDDITNDFSDNSSDNYDIKSPPVELFSESDVHDIFGGDAINSILRNSPKPTATLASEESSKSCSRVEKPTVPDSNVHNAIDNKVRVGTDDRSSSHCNLANQCEEKECESSNKLQSTKKKVSNGEKECESSNKLQSTKKKISSEEKECESSIKLQSPKKKVSSEEKECESSNMLQSPKKKKIDVQKKSTESSSEDEDIPKQLRPKSPPIIQTVTDNITGTEVKKSTVIVVPKTEQQTPDEIVKRKFTEMFLCNQRCRTHLPFTTLPHRRQSNPAIRIDRSLSFAVKNNSELKNTESNEKSSHKKPKILRQPRKRKPEKSDFDMYIERLENETNKAKTTGRKKTPAEMDPKLNLQPRVLIERIDLFSLKSILGKGTSVKAQSSSRSNVKELKIQAEVEDKSTSLSTQELNPDEDISCTFLQHNKKHDVNSTERQVNVSATLPSWKRRECKVKVRRLSSISEHSKNFSMSTTEKILNLPTQSNKDGTSHSSCLETNIVNNLEQISASATTSKGKELQLPVKSLLVSGAAQHPVANEISPEIDVNRLPRIENLAVETVQETGVSVVSSTVDLPEKEQRGSRKRKTVLERKCYATSDPTDYDMEFFADWPNAPSTTTQSVKELINQKKRQPRTPKKASSLKLFNEKLKSSKRFKSVDGTDSLVPDLTESSNSSALHFDRSEARSSNSTPESHAISSDSPVEMIVKSGVSRTYASGNIIQNVYVPPEVLKIIDDESTVSASPSPTPHSRKVMNKQMKT